MTDELQTEMLSMLLSMLRDRLDVRLTVEHNYDGGRLGVEVRFMDETIASDTIALSDLEPL